MNPILRIRGLGKEFLLHLQGATRIPVFHDFDLDLNEAEALGIVGPSGMGKSSLLKLINGTYKIGRGQILIRHLGEWIDIARSAPREILALRKNTVGYVTQFLRVIPRVPTLDVVAEPLLDRGVDAAEARRQAQDMLARLAIPERLWPLSPLTFSGGEQQRVNIARGFVASYPLLLLDEPTASLDTENRARVLDLIAERKRNGTAIIGIFHSPEDRQLVCNRLIDLADLPTMNR